MLFSKGKYETNLLFEQKKRFCIYRLVCPIKNIPIYVGCTIDIQARYKAHFTSGCVGYASPLAKYIYKLRSRNKYPILEIIDWIDNEKKASKVEVDKIAEYLINGVPLFNTQRGFKYSYHNNWKINRRNKINELLNIK